MQAIFYCERYDIKEFPCQNIKAPFSKVPLTTKMKMVIRPDGFIINAKMKADIFPTSELLFSNKND